MGNLTLTGLDEATLRRLRRRAEERGQTMEAEAAEFLAAQLEAEELLDWPLLLAEVRRQTEGTIKTKTIELIRESRSDLS